MTLALIAGLSTMAQDADNDGDKKTPEERAKHHTEMMTKDLKLDASQQTKVAEINLRYAKNLQDIKAVQDNNILARSFPSNLTAMVFSYAPKPSFAVQNEAAISTPPVVDFNKK